MRAHCHWSTAILWHRFSSIYASYYECTSLPPTHLHSDCMHSALTISQKHSMAPLPWKPDDCIMPGMEPEARGAHRVHRPIDMRLDENVLRWSRHQSPIWYLIGRGRTREQFTKLNSNFLQSPGYRFLFWDRTISPFHLPNTLNVCNLYCVSSIYFSF